MQPTKNTAERIADALRTAISQGHLQEGQSLRQDEIAKEFAVSKIPVREALFRLQAEGLIDMIPNKGAVVATLTAAEINEIYVMRTALETILLKRAIPRLTAADILQAEQILDRIDQETDNRKWSELNWAFHERIYVASEMHRIINTVKSFHANVVRYLLANLTTETDQYLATSQQEHRELLAACRAGDIDAACLCLEHHLSGADSAFTS